jgi:hypothetical protein
LLKRQLNSGKTPTSAEEVDDENDDEDDDDSDDGDEKENNQLDVIKKIVGKIRVLVGLIMIFSAHLHPHTLSHSKLVLPVHSRHFRSP